MIRAALVCLALSTPLQAQDIALPDVNVIRTDPRLDMSWIPSLAMQQAIAAAEDISWFDTFPATSPISQQVVKNYLLSAERSLIRKTMEIQLAINLANAYSADEIMSIFAQRAYLGANCYGFDAALTHRLATSVEDATLADLVTLAAVMRGPAFFATDPDRLTERFAFVVDEGTRSGFWDDATASALKSTGPSAFIDGKLCPFQ